MCAALVILSLLLKLQSEIVFDVFAAKNLMKFLPPPKRWLPSYSAAVAAGCCLLLCMYAYLSGLSAHRLPCPMARWLAFSGSPLADQQDSAKCSRSNAALVA
jgi:hypothetical protein